jgi:hypothetical protein
MPVTPFTGVVEGDDDHVADADGDLLIAAGAAVGLRRLVRLNAPQFGDATRQGVIYERAAPCHVAGRHARVSRTVAPRRAAAPFGDVAPVRWRAAPGFVCKVPASETVV